MNANAVLHCLFKVQRRCISITTVRPLIQKWRGERGLPLNPNACGILTDKPDYTYLDGRLTPCGSRQKDRIIKQRNLAQKIIELTKEVDFAVDRHNKMQLDEKENREKIIRNKLKPKGDLLLKK